MKFYKFFIKGIQTITTTDKTFYFYHCEAKNAMPNTEGSFYISIYASSLDHSIGEEILCCQNGRYWNIVDFSDIEAF